MPGNSRIRWNASLLPKAGKRQLACLQDVWPFAHANTVMAAALVQALLEVTEAGPLTGGSCSTGLAVVAPSASLASLVAASAGGDEPLPVGL